jgi:hypothetical protein
MQKILGLTDDSQGIYWTSPDAMAEERTVVTGVVADGYTYDAADQKWVKYTKRYSFEIPIDYHVSSKHLVAS